MMIFYICNNEKIKNQLREEIKSLKVEMQSQKKSFNDFLEDADFNVIEAVNSHNPRGLYLRATFSSYR